MKIRSIKEIDLNSKKVVVRADFDVPFISSQNKDRNQPGGTSIEIADDFRLTRMLPTFDYLVSKMAKIVVLGHNGRPTGRVIEEYRLAPAVKWLKNHYSHVSYLKAVTGFDVRQAVISLRETEILILENVRFETGEEENRESFARELSTYGQFFINECFASSHRAHASTFGISNFLPAYAGFNLINEVEVLSEVLTHARKPLLVIIGGSKIETKVPVIERFLKLADKVLVTGKIGGEMKKFPHYQTQKLIYSTGDPDIFPDELDRFSALISIAGTIVWNGPAGDTSRGYIEGTKRLAELITSSSARTIAGGGDTTEFLRKMGLRDRFHFISTGGGAMLDFLAGKEMPGLKPLLVP